MEEHREFLDAFANARRTWDDLVTIQPDIMAGSGKLDTESLLELERRVSAHREAIDLVANVLDTKPGEVTQEFQRIGSG